MARVSRKLSARRRDSRDPSDVLRRSVGKGCCCPNCRQERPGLIRCSPSVYSDAPSLAVREFAPQLRVPDLGREASSRPVELERLDREPTCFPSGVHLPPAPPSEDAVPLCSRLAVHNQHDEKVPGRSLPPPPLLLLLLDKAHGPLAIQKEEARPQSELACKAQSHVAVQAEEEARHQSHAAVQAEEACKAQSHVAVQAEEEARHQSHAAVQAEEACKAQSHVAVEAKEEARPQSHAAVQAEEDVQAQFHAVSPEALPVECAYEMDTSEADPEFSGVMSPPLAPSPSSSSSCEAEVKELQVASASSLRPARKTSFSSSEVQSVDVPKRQTEVSETRSALGQGGNGNKKTIRPEYVDLIRLTSKMKKEAERRVPSKGVNLSQEDSSSTLRTERMVGGRRVQSDAERLRSAMRLFPRKVPR